MEVLVVHVLLTIIKLTSLLIASDNKLPPL
jgi:hypothetical protein